jgi:ribosomal protein S1
LLKVGDKIRAQIIQLDHSKIYLSIKRLVDDPWKKVKDKYKTGDTVKGKVIKVEPFGLMISLDKDIHGLAHISELSDEPIVNINDKFKIGQELEMVVVSLEPAEHRLGLRMAGVKGKTGRKAEAAAKAAEDQKKDEDEAAKKLDELAAVEAEAEKKAE